MPCTVKKTFVAASKAKCELLVQVKGNQPNLLEDILETTQTSKPVEVDKTKRSRQEPRIVETFEPPETFQDEDWNELIGTLVPVRRLTHVRCAKDQSWEKREEVSYNSIFCAPTVRPTSPMPSGITSSISIGCWPTGISDQH